MPDPLSEQLGSKSNSNQGKSSFLGTLGQNTLSSLVSGGVSSLFSELFADSQQHRMRENMRYQQQLNLDSLRKSPLMQVLGLKDAGLNPALLNGQVTGNTAQVSPGSPSGALTPISMSEMFNAINAKANARYANAMAEKQEIENENAIHKNKRLGKFAYDMLGSLYESGAIKHSNPFYKVSKDPTTGELVLTWTPTEATGYSSRDFNAGDYQALKDVYQYMKDTNYNDFNSSQLEKMNKSKNSILDNIIKDNQISDPEVIKALKSLPIQTLNNLVAQTQDYLASATLKGSENQLTLKQKDIADLQETYMKNSSFDEAIKRISNPKSIGDFFKGVFLFILNFVRENVSLHK